MIVLGKCESVIVFECIDLSIVKIVNVSRLPCTCIEQGTRVLG